MLRLRILCSQCANKKSATLSLQRQSICKNNTNKDYSTINMIEKSLRRKSLYRVEGLEEGVDGEGGGEGGGLGAESAWAEGYGGEAGA